MTSTTAQKRDAEEFERLARLDSSRPRTKAERAARDAEVKRILRNSDARRRRAAKKAARKEAAVRERDIPRLIKALGYLSSPNPNERDNAARAVERLRAKLGKTWRELLK